MTAKKTVRSNLFLSNGKFHIQKYQNKIGVALFLCRKLSKLVEYCAENEAENEANMSINLSNWFVHVIKKRNHTLANNKLYFRRKLNAFYEAADRAPCCHNTQMFRYFFLPIHIVQYFEWVGCVRFSYVVCLMLLFFSVISLSLTPFSRSLCQVFSDRWKFMWYVLSYGLAMRGIC